LKDLWKVSSFRESILKQTDTTVFARFFQYVVGDCLYATETAIEKLSEVKHFEKSDLSSLDQIDRVESQTEFRRNKDAARFYFEFARRNLWMMHVITTNVPESIERAELFPPFAKALNYFISILIKQENLLDVNEPKFYRFVPQEVFAEIIQIYISLDRFPSFITAVVEDPYSFSEELFKKVSDFNFSCNWVGADAAKALLVFAQSVQTEFEKTRKQFVSLSEDDVPPEFLDQIVFTVMEDPVLLPNGEHVDRKTIKEHLLNDPTNPFTREPLTMDQVKPDVELKAKIEAFLETHKQNN
jgi:ubiquitin conjugation factor E4 B